MDSLTIDTLQVKLVPTIALVSYVQKNYLWFHNGGGNILLILGGLWDDFNLLLLKGRSRDRTLSCTELYHL